jgi:hypothetical protein
MEDEDMKKDVTAGLVVFVIVGFVLFGCGKKEETHTVSTPGGKMKVTTDRSGQGGRVEIETKEGKTVITGEQGGTVTETQLGVPVYPGATLKASTKMEGTGGRQGAVEIYTLASSDNWEKVSAFYKSNLKNVKGNFTQGSGDKGVAMFSIGEKGDITVNVVADGKNGTAIQVAKKLK